MKGGGLVAVTGANGYIASHLVKQLLERGYRVVGSVRDANNAPSVAHLVALPGAAERLRLVSADLNEASHWDAVVQGADAVMHTAYVRC